MMTDFLETIEILIDQLILRLPSEWFVDAPFLATLLSNPNGRYILAGILVVTSLIILWIFFLLVQVLFVGRSGNSDRSALQNMDETGSVSLDEGVEGFKFFKRNNAISLTTENEAALKAIEKDMLIVRQRYLEGQLAPDAYVSETRRLYRGAKALKP